MSQKDVIYEKWIEKSDSFCYIHGTSLYTFILYVQEYTLLRLQPYLWETLILFF